jgi:PAS domain S-box-containing protein
MHTPKIRVMLADDDAGLLAAIADTVRSAPDLELVATAQNANEVAQRAQTSKPDVIVMDVSMPGGGGVAAAHEVARRLPDTRVVALSAHEDRASALLMLEAGAVAYIVKGVPEPEILDAIRRAHRGQMSLPAELGSSTVKELARELHERQESEAARRRSEQRGAAILESVPDATVIIGPGGAIELVNTQTEKLFGYQRGELIGQPVELLLPERFRGAYLRHRPGYLSKPQSRPIGAELELHGRRRDGTEFPVDVSLNPMEAESGTLIIAAVRVVTNRHDAQRKLDESFDIAQRQRLFARLIAAQEEERLRIASDIHDDTIQAMTATSLRMQQLRRHLTDPGQIELLSRLEEAVRESIARLRRLMFDLRPASLDRSGLSSALRELLERLHEETHLTFTLESHLNSEPAGSIRTALYRIAQEALANVTKHAAASTVKVELRSVGSGCRVRIQDDGRGFEVEGSEAKPENLGLVSMRERAQIAGGWWLVRCPDEGGTVVEFWLPFETETSPVGGEPVGGLV